MSAGRQKGIALVMVLWVVILITVASGAFALMARMDQLEANTLLSSTQARMMAEGGIHLMAISLRDSDEVTRIIADGRSYQQEIQGILLDIQVVDERGKLDVNSADEQTLATLFVNNGMDLDQAEMLAGAIMDWRDSDDVERVNGAELDAYLAAGLEIGPANRPFMMTDELLQVLGMPFELYRNIEPGISVYSKSAVPDIAFAPVEALLAIPDISLEDATNFVSERVNTEPEDWLGVSLSNGQVVMAQGKGLTYSVRAKATMPNGIWEQVEATIRLGGSSTGTPFRVLRWREGYHH